MATACDHSPQQVRVAEAYTDVKGGGGVTENAKKEIMSKDKEGMGSEARIALNLHKRPRRRARTWSVGIGDRVWGYGFIYFRLAEGFPPLSPDQRDKAIVVRTWFYFRIGVPAWSHVEPSAIQRIHDTEVISDSTFIYCIVSTLGK